MYRFALIAALLCSPAFGDEIDAVFSPPVAAKSVGTPVGATIIVRQGAKRIGKTDALVSALLNLSDGTYTVEIWPEEGEITRTFTFTIGSGVSPSPAVVIPPGPSPVVVPPVVPVAAGKRFVLLVHESKDDSPEIGATIVALRTGEPSKYLAAKGHTLKILDDDSVDQFGKPAKDVEQWRLVLAGVKLPAVVVVDPATNKALAVESIADKPTSGNVMEILRKVGG